MTEQSAASPLSVGDRLIMVGRRWVKPQPTDWSVWDAPYDTVVEAVQKRMMNYRPGSVTFEVVEVAVERRTAVSAEVTVTEADRTGSPA